MNNVSRAVSHSKIALGLWMLTVSILTTLFLLTVWSHFYKPDLFGVIMVADYVLIPVAFCLLLLSLALNRWKPLMKKAVNS